MRKTYLYSPGPTTVPPEALAAMAEPMFHHRTQRYQDLFKEVVEGLQRVLFTKSPVLVFTASGTGAMEGSLVNLCSPGDHIITVNGGKFGERWTQLGKAYGLDVDEIAVEWGHAVDPAEVKRRLKPGVKAVYIQLCETSTAVVNDVRAVAEIVRDTDAVLVVDTISGLLCDACPVDEWGVDVAVGGSQKGLMIPPGLAFASVSEKAWRLVEQSRLPKYYFSFAKTRKALADFDTPFTPAVSLVRALRQSLAIIEKEGIDAMLRRAALYAEALRAGAGGLDLRVYPKAPSNAVTAVCIPDGVDGGKFLKVLEKEFGVTFAGGQDALKGKVFRIATMGYVNQFDILTALSAVEFALRSFGYRFEPGAGVRAAQAVLLGGAK